MDVRLRAAFLTLIAAQAVHSVEEYHFRLYDVLALSRWVSEAIGPDRATGFMIGNAAILLLGFGCYFASIRPDRRSARAVAWLWALLEIANGVVHIALALAAGGYFPGRATAPFLLVAAFYLALRLQAPRGR